MATIKDWRTDYPSLIDTDTQQPVLVNGEDFTRISQIHALRNATQTLEGQVGRKIFVHNYSNNINSAIQALSGTLGTVVILDGTTVTLTGSYTIPSNINLEVHPGGLINASTFNLVHSGAIFADRYQIFATGSGVISCSNVEVAYPEWWAAAGDGNTNDTTPIQQMFRCGAKNYDFGNKTYLVNVTEGDQLAKFVAQTGIRIIGRGATIKENKVYSIQNAITPMFFFSGSCLDCEIDGVNYSGSKLANPATTLGYTGATFVNIVYGCKNIRVNSKLENLRYGVLSNQHAYFAQAQAADANIGITTKLNTSFCGYPVALYLADKVDLDIYAEDTHRAAYLAGVHGGRIDARFKNQYIAPIQVILSDTRIGVSSSRGCEDLVVRATDVGSTINVKDSWAAGISLSHVDPGTTYKNLDFTINISGSDTIANTMGAFILNSTVKAILPSTPTNWDHSIEIDNITIRGILDRSAQTTIFGNSAAEIAIYAVDTTETSSFPIVKNLNMENFIYKSSVLGHTASVVVDYRIPGLTGSSYLRNCDFSPLTGKQEYCSFATNTSSLLTFDNCRLDGTSFSPFDYFGRCALVLINCDIGYSTLQPTHDMINIGSRIGTRDLGAGRKVSWQNDVEISGSANGLVLNSSDGSKWRIGINNAGVISGSKI